MSDALWRSTMFSSYLDTIQISKKKYAALLEPLCRQYALTRNELDVMLFLHNNPEFRRAADIVTIRQIAKSHVSLSVNTLESRGLLTREFDPEDRRTAHLKLTEAALPIVQAGAALQQEFFQHIFGGLTPEEIAIWQSILDKVSRNIKTMEE